MNVLIGCEFSGVVREAFRLKGHNAWSCDLLPADDGSPYHLIADLETVLSYPRQQAPWDLLIAHPPCTRLTNAGVRWLYSGGKGRIRNLRKWNELERAARFFEVCLGRHDGPTIQRIAVENPIMHQHAMALVNCLYDQVVQPWMFGHQEMKATCLWLRGLPKLVPTNMVGPPTKEQRKTWNRVHRESPGPDRWKRRSITYQGIANAMADQWGRE